MLERVEAGDRIGDPVEPRIVLHQVALEEFDPRVGRFFEGTEIDHLDLAERRDMRDEPVDPRADVDMAARGGFVDQ